MKYRKRPVVVEASQWWKPGDHAAVVHPIPAGVPIVKAGLATHAVEAMGAIQTLEGWILVSPGDFVIRGVHGEFYPCKPDIFEKTYEPAEEPSPAPTAPPIRTT
jgi:hypothetical protein